MESPVPLSPFSDRDSDESPISPLQLSSPEAVDSQLKNSQSAPSLVSQQLILKSFKTKRPRGETPPFPSAPSEFSPSPTAVSWIDKNQPTANPFYSFSSGTQPSDISPSQYPRRPYSLSPEFDLLVPQQDPIDQDSTIAIRNQTFVSSPLPYKPESDPISHISARKVKQSKNSHREMCSICLEPKCSSQLTAIQCGHVFHRSCISSWTSSQTGKIAKCPECKQPCLQLIDLFFEFSSEEVSQSVPKSISYDTKVLLSNYKLVKEKAIRRKSAILQAKQVIEKLKLYIHKQKQHLERLQSERDIWKNRYFLLNSQQ